MPPLVALSNSNSSSNGAGSSKATAVSHDAMARHFFLLAVFKELVPVMHPRDVYHALLPLVLRYAESTLASVTQRSHALMQSSVLRIFAYAETGLLDLAEQIEIAKQQRQSRLRKPGVSYRWLPLRLQRTLSWLGSWRSGASDVATVGSERDEDDSEDSLNGDSAKGRAEAESDVVSSSLDSSMTNGTGATSTSSSNGVPSSTDITSSSSMQRALEHKQHPHHGHAHSRAPRVQLSQRGDVQALEHEALELIHLLVATRGLLPYYTKLILSVRARLLYRVLESR